MHSLSAVQIRDRIHKGETKAVTIIENLLKRIHKHDPQIGAFLNLCGDKALEQAHAIDKKRTAGQKIGRLAGVPIAVKDIIHVKGELTTCGSRFLTNYRALFNATSVKLLTDEDAICLGKTNCDEFAMGSSTENSALQKTVNPWNFACVPGGSSGGSAAAVAARFCPIALGTDTGGSIRQPAAFCGVVGFKPTYGRVSRYGVVAFGSSLDQVGPIAVSTEDAALTMSIIGQHCLHDSTSLPDPAEDYLSTLHTLPKNLRIGVPRKFLEGLSPEVRKNFDASLEALKALGAKIVDVSLDLSKYAVAIYYVIAPAEASTNLARFDGIRYGQRSPRAETLDEVYDYSKEEGYGAEVKRRILIGTFVLSSGYKEAYYRKAQQVRTLVIREFAEAFRQCDLIATPTTPEPPFAQGAIKDPLKMYLEDIFTIPADLAGIPAISVPSGFSSQGLPLGLQLMGPQKQDIRVCQVAHAYELATKFAQQMPNL